MSQLIISDCIHLTAIALIVLDLFQHNTTKPSSQHRQLNRVMKSKQEPSSLHSCLTPTYPQAWIDKLEGLRRIVGGQYRKDLHSWLGSIWGTSGNGFIPQNTQQSRAVSTPIDEERRWVWWITQSSRRTKTNPGRAKKQPSRYKEQQNDIVRKNCMQLFVRAFFKSGPRQNAHFSFHSIDYL